MPANASATSRRIAPSPPKKIHSDLKDVRDFLKQVAAGLNTIPSNESFTTSATEKARETLDAIENFEKLYAEKYAETEVKRTTGLKPRLCDKKLTNFLSEHFHVFLPEMNQHGICDLNSLVLRGLSIYAKEQRLNTGHFILLDDQLQRLFSGPAVNNPSKTYLDLAKERIAELSAERAAKKESKASTSVAEILEKDGQVSLNYAALKILVSHFKVDYSPPDTDKYLPQLQEFEEILKKKSEQFEEAKKRAKKASKE